MGYRKQTKCEAMLRSLCQGFTWVASITEETMPESSMSSVRSFAFTCCLTTFLVAIAVGAEAGDDAATVAGQWPQFLGPERCGISKETGLLDAWPDNGPSELWRSPGGVGMSGLAVGQGQVVTLVQRDGRQWLVSLNAKTGKRNWETAIASEYQNQMGDGPRATPAISEGVVFAFTGDGTLAAVNLNDGKILWSHPIMQELKGKVADYGMASSPLIVGDQVIVIAGAPQATVVAFDKSSGKLVWRAGDDPAGYSSPTILTVGSAQQLVAFTGNSLIGLELGTGKLLWRFPFATDFKCNIATPIAIEDGIFISSGENHGSVLLRPSKRGNETHVEPVWESLGPKSVLRNEWQTSVLLDGHLYGFDNVGSAGPVTHLTCINAATGERVWQELRFGKGNLIAADGKLLISTMDGEFVMVRATPEGFQELGRKQVLGSTRQAPSLAAGLVYLRDDAEIVCLDLRRKE